VIDLAKFPAIWSVTRSLSDSWDEKKSRFSTNISLYLGNDTTYGSYSGKRIGTLMQSAERCHPQFQGHAIIQR